MWQTSKQEAISWIQQHIECITQQRSGESSVYTVLSLFYEGRETIFDSLLTQVYIYQNQVRMGDPVVKKTSVWMTYPIASLCVETWKCKSGRKKGFFNCLYTQTSR